VEFYVNYTIDRDGNAGTFDPVLPWATGQLIWDRHVGVYDVFRYETSFALGTYIYWQFFIRNAFTWISDVHGPELIYTEGMVNKETLFKVNGHKYNYFDNKGLGGWTITLYKDGDKFAETQTDHDGYYEFLGLVPGYYTVCETVKTDDGWAPHGPTCYEFTADSAGDRTFDFYNYKMLRITDTSEYRYELPSFDLVFTPAGEGSGLYKLSSTNPGSFYTNVVKYGDASTPVRIELNLPPDQENAEYDSPNFILHHTYIGSTPVVDIHVYGGRLTSVGEWVPDWSKDITSLFSITTTTDGKNATVEGYIPDTGTVFVTVHIDYQISASLTWEQVQTFSNFKYTFSVLVYASIFGTTTRLPVGSVK